MSETNGNNSFSSELPEHPYRLLWGVRIPVEPESPLGKTKMELTIYPEPVEAPAGTPSGQEPAPKIKITAGTAGKVVMRSILNGQALGAEKPLADLPIPHGLTVTAVAPERIPGLYAYGLPEGAVPLGPEGFEEKTKEE